MKYLTLLSLAALATGIVIPDEQVLSELAIEPREKDNSLFDSLPSTEDISSKADHIYSTTLKTSKNLLDDALSVAEEASARVDRHFQCFESMTAFDAQSWSELASEHNPFNSFGGGEHPPHHGPDHGHHGHHGHHDKPNQTVYQLISESKYTTKLAALVQEDADLVRVLNSTKSNFTLFAPTDSAFEKIPDHHKEPSKELIKKVLLYHISPDFYPAGRVLVTHTIPTLLKVAELGDQPQRLRVGLGLNGLAVNFYSRIVGVNFFGTNGVIHAVNSVILPPPETLRVIQLLPSEFSTLELGLHKTGLFKDFENTAQAGGTFFAPNNFAFQKLGPKINAFLFSSRGTKYLKELLKYHVISNTTLYSDAYYPRSDSRSDSQSTDIPNGSYHLDLPSLLDGKPLSVDIFRYGGYISIKINGFSTVTTQDGIAKDGVIQDLSNVLIPPKKLGDDSSRGEELTPEELMERLEPFVDHEMEL